MFYFIAGVCAYIVVCFPFALWARRISRQDAFSTTEAYILGQSCGPIGVWLVMRENRKAAAAEYRAGLLVDHKRTMPDELPRETPQQMEQRLKASPPPLLNAAAYRAQHEIKPAIKPGEMPTFAMNDVVRPGPAPKEEKPPHEPAPPPLTKAGIAWRPPPSANPAFLHSDEQHPQAGGGPPDA